MRATIESAIVRDTEDRLAVFDTVAADVIEAAKVEELRTEVADSLSVEARIAPPAG